MINLEPSLEDLMTKTIEKIKNIHLYNDKVLSISPGSINRLILSIVNEELHEIYKELNKRHLMAFMSTASGDSLNLIGKMFNCERDVHEDDNSYKNRIKGQLALLETGNELAIKLALLSVDGVDDVKLIKYTKGSGSFSAFIVTKDVNNAESIISTCQSVLDEKASYGVCYEVSLPEFIPIELQIKVILLNNKQLDFSLQEKIKNKVTKYINSRNIGEDIIINEIIQLVMEESEDIYDMEIKRMVVNNIPVTPSNQCCEDYQRFIESSKPDSISIL